MNESRGLSAPKVASESSCQSRTIYIERAPYLNRREVLCLKHDKNCTKNFGPEAVLVMPLRIGAS
jgi:hypothetical protein